MKILLIDDSEDQINMISTFIESAFLELGELDVEFDKFSNIEWVLDNIESFGFYDFAFIDYHLKNDSIDGKGIVDKIREMRIAAECFILSGDAIAARSESRYAFISKGDILDSIKFSQLISKGSAC